MYEAVVDTATANRLAGEGYEVVSTEQAQDGVRVVLVLYPWQRKALEKQGVDLVPWTNTEGVTATDLAAQQEERGLQGLPGLRRARRHPGVPRRDRGRQPGPAQARGDRPDPRHRS